MRRAGVLINLASGRGNGRGQALAEHLRNGKNISLRILNNFNEIAPSLDQLASDGITDLFVSSGDGTIQAALTHLVESERWAAAPRICVLPHGTTNLSAGDIGFKRRSTAAQADFITTLPDATHQTRHSLRVINPKTGGPRHGLTFGAGAAATATRHAQTNFNDKGVKGSLASFATIASGLSKAAFTSPSADDLSRLDRPCFMQIETKDGINHNGPQLMFIATTLNHLFFKTNPFWGKRNGPIRATAIPYPVPNVFRWALPLMFGREDRKVPDGALSFSGNGFAVTCAEPYVMDGEFFEGPENAPLSVEAGPAFTFITG